MCYQLLMITDPENVANWQIFSVFFESNLRKILTALFLFRCRVVWENVSIFTRKNEKVIPRPPTWIQHGTKIEGKSDLEATFQKKMEPLRNLRRHERIACAPSP